MYEKMGRRFRTVSRFVSLEISKFMRFQPGFLFAIFDFNIRVYVRTYVRAVSPRNLSFFSSLFFFSPLFGRLFSTKKRLVEQRLRLLAGEYLIQRFLAECQNFF